MSKHLQTLFCQSCGTAFSIGSTTYETQWHKRTCSRECWWELEWKQTLAILDQPYAFPQDQALPFSIMIESFPSIGVYVSLVCSVCQASCSIVVDSKEQHPQAPKYIIEAALHPTHGDSACSHLIQWAMPRRALLETTPRAPGFSWEKETK